jgi:hypothetical protein
MSNTRTHPRPDGLASVSAKNVEIPSEKHKTKNSAKVAVMCFQLKEDLRKQLRFLLVSEGFKAQWNILERIQITIKKKTVVSTRNVCQPIKLHQPRVNVPFMCQTMKFQKQFKIRPDLTGSDRTSQDQTRTDRIRPVRNPEGQSCVPGGPERSGPIVSKKTKRTFAIVKQKLSLLRNHQQPLLYYLGKRIIIL